jgi:hypothetical protein
MSTKNVPSRLYRPQNDRHRFRTDKELAEILLPNIDELENLPTPDYFSDLELPGPEYRE